MDECRTTMTERGQVTIPQAIRNELGLRRGDRIVFRYEGEQTFTVRKDRPRKRPTAGLLDKYLGRKTQGVSVEDMQHAIEEGATRGFKS